MQLMLCQLISAVDLSRKSLNDRLSHVTIERSAEVCQSSDSNFLRKLSHEFSFKKTVILCHHNYFFFFIPSKNFLSLSLVALFICYYFVYVSLSIYLSLYNFFSQIGFYFLKKFKILMRLVSTQSETLRN